jgi:hypothetical protein
MAFDWENLLDLAEQLGQQAINEPASAEARQRTAIGRAYFASFCHARNYAESYLKYRPKKDERDHGSLRAHLKGKRRHGDADRLERLRQWRNQVDYLNVLPWSDIQTVVDTAIAEAEKIFKGLTPPASSASS